MKKHEKEERQILESWGEAVRVFPAAGNTQKLIVAHSTPIERSVQQRFFLVTDKKFDNFQRRNRIRNHEAPSNTLINSEFIFELLICFLCHVVRILSRPKFTLPSKQKCNGVNLHRND